MKASRLLLALGLLGIVFAILNFFVWIFDPARGGADQIWFLGNLVVGVALVLAGVFSNLDELRERVSSGEARRAGKYGTSALVSTGLLLVIIATLGFLSTRYHKRFDWSEAGVHSLTSQSQAVLDGLDRDVEVLALFPPLDAAPARELLDRYAYVSDRFRVEYADPNERPELLARHDITPEALGQGVVRVALGDEAVLVDEVTEEKITNALVKLTRSGDKKVYFLEGHNERPIEGERAAEREGFERAAAALRNENYQVEKLLLAAQGEVPEDADALVVPGATRPLLAAERKALERYLESGGALLVLIDPRAHTDLVDDLRTWGVDVGEDVIVEGGLKAIFGQPATPIAAQYDPQHEITREMREPAVFHMARSIRSGDGGDFTEIVFTAESSWGERDVSGFYERGVFHLDPDDLKGPVPVAVAGTPRLGANGDSGAAAEEPAEEAEPAEDGGAGARLVVFGDADFAANELIEAYRNRDLFVNSVNWLIGDIEAISIRPAISRATRLGFASADQFRQIRTLSLFVLPQLIAVVGVFVWWSRRRVASGR